VGHQAKRGEFQLAVRIGNNNDGGGVMKLRIKVLDLINCVVLNKYDELAKKYELGQKALKDMKAALEKGDWTLITD